MSEELMIIEEQYPALTGGGDVAALVAENLDGEDLSPWDLDTIKVPGSGGTAWTVETLTGDETFKELDVIIVHQKLVRSYWAEGLEESGGGSSPDCFSQDSIAGIGDPGGDCHGCPMAEFGSADKGSGQACKQMRQLFVLRPGSMLPTVVTIPPSSLKNAKKFLLRLASQGSSYRDVVTRLTLEKDKNEAGIVFARVTFAVAEMVPEDIRSRVLSYANGIKPALERPQREEAA